MRWYVVLPVLLAGCGVSEQKYIEKRVDAECAFALKCYPANVLEFDAWKSADDCTNDLGPRFATQYQSCTGYDKKSATACVKAWNDLAKADCPSGDTLTTYPAVCDQVYTGCPGPTDTAHDTADTFK